ncbi:MIP/aquaporin family protein [Corynebacterium minutissimum]|uniref:Aquaporin family protein n=1 Tax=Corynebacterium minutissimum TaxID=38301 RepID=A0A2X4U6S9_9CORY|nr:MIP/aquaporin family protein [Corynebacterium minutissimum]KHO30690.1 glycerol transporter [Corynebacterium minutissimum]QPS59830.1 aquaporin family protein [Corynebacterium minutissimum]QQA79379.1 aquaporin family protein [Corynebacterium minutissimum]SQH98345.1 glycerol uptake facilitator protein [Corynebacterium minutissimum]VEG04554.1 glycerol uptake facilitator protein [Corynebacterium minutissimum]
MAGTDAFLWEFLGTAVLLLLGNGVCATVNLRTSAARGADWIVIAMGWGLGVYLGASIADPSGGHLNPAVTIMLAVNGSLEWSLVPYYLLGQILGAMVGAFLAWATFKQLFDANNVDEAGNVTGANKNTGGIFFTNPAHPNNGWNAVTEFIATTVLLMFIAFGPTGGELGPLSYFGVAFVIVSIGLSLGTPTGYAINPVRDLGPRIMYAFVLPIKDKGTGNWSYAWVPVVAPTLSAVAVGLLSIAL